MGPKGRHDSGDDAPLLHQAQALIAMLDSTFGMGFCTCGQPGLVTIAMRDEELQCSECREHAEQYRKDEMGEAA